MIIDSRLRIPAGLPRGLAADLKDPFRHKNPDFYKKERIGLKTFGTPRVIETWEWEDASKTAFSLPRGGAKKIREIAAAHGYRVRFIDRRVRRPAIDWPEVQADLRWYQREALEAAIAKQQGIVRAPTGSGKTLIAFAYAAATRQPTLVVMRDSKLLDQWFERATKKELRLDPKEIGVLKGGKKLRLGPRLTLALQQTLYSDTFPMSEVSDHFGTVIVDEVHTVAARTFQKVIKAFPAANRVGFSADETRKDGKEFLVYDQFGEVVYEVKREALEDEGSIRPVQVRMFETGFDADWYSSAGPAERDFGALLDEMTNDEARNAQIVGMIEELVRRGETPIFIFTHRVEHARTLADRYLFARGIASGLLIGGKENEVRFAEDKARVDRGELAVAVGTFQSIGQGIDVPLVRAGLLATPISSNPQFFGQVRGRVCRPAPGKESASLYVAWDRSIFPQAPKNMGKWNSGRVEVIER